jgi:hypothetical protein
MAAHRFPRQLEDRVFRHRADQTLPRKQFMPIPENSSQLK